MIGCHGGRLLHSICDHDSSRLRRRLLGRAGRRMARTITKLHYANVAPSRRGPCSRHEGAHFPQQIAFAGSNLLLVSRRIRHLWHPGHPAHLQEFLRRLGLTLARISRRSVQTRPRLDVLRRGRRNGCPRGLRCCSRSNPCSMLPPSKL